MKIGVLDIQGSVIEHAKALKRAGADVVFVKNAGDLADVSGLVMPGGESTTMGKLLRRFGLREEIMRLAGGGLPIYGSCAGAILMAGKIGGEQQADTLGLMNIEIERNAYGRQMDSFETEIEFGGEKIPAIFIRAPKILKIGNAVEVLSEYEGEIVALREGNLFVTSFHPELTDDLSVHRYFLKICGEVL